MVLIKATRCAEISRLGRSHGISCLVGHLDQDHRPVVVGLGFRLGLVLDVGQDFLRSCLRTSAECIPQVSSPCSALRFCSVTPSVYASRESPASSRIRESLRYGSWKAPSIVPSVQAISRVPSARRTMGRGWPAQQTVSSGTHPPAGAACSKPCRALPGVPL